MLEATVSLVGPLLPKSTRDARQQHIQRLTTEMQAGGFEVELRKHLAIVKAKAVEGRKFILPTHLLSRGFTPVVRAFECRNMEMGRVICDPDGYQWKTLKMGAQQQTPYGLACAFRKQYSIGEVETTTHGTTFFKLAAIASHDSIELVRTQVMRFPSTRAEVMNSGAYNAMMASYHKWVCRNCRHVHYGDGF